MLKKQSKEIKKEIAELTIILDGNISYNELMGMSSNDIQIFTDAFKEVKKKQSGK